MNKIFKILIFLLFIFSVNFCFASIQDKVGYLICVSVNKDTPKQDISKLIKEYNVKSFNLVGSWNSEKEVTDFIEYIKKESNNTQLFIAVDQEGEVNRLKFIQETSQNNVNIIESLFLAYNRGKTLNKLGFNMVFSPVLDFSSSPSDYIYNRTFQKNKTDSILTGLNMIKGYSLANIYSVPKHFPGYVNCEQDPHGLICQNNFGVLKKSIDIFKEVLKLFKYDFIMFGHNIIKEFGDKPITKSSKFVDWFRKNINSEQIYVTDSIGMGSYINNETDYSTQALDAVKSGYDIIILPSNLYFSYQALDGLYSNLDDDLVAKNINTSYNKLNKYIK